jgi:hypothetical protein
VHEYFETGDGSVMTREFVASKWTAVLRLWREYGMPEAPILTAQQLEWSGDRPALDRWVAQA